MMREGKVNGLVFCKKKSSKKPFRRIPQPCQSGPKTECSNSPDSTLPISSFSFHIQFLTDVSVNMYVLYPNNCGLLFFWREYLVIWWENIYTVWNWDQWHLAWMQFVRSFCREAKNIGVCPALPTSLDILNLFKASKLNKLPVQFIGKSHYAYEYCTMYIHI